MKSSLPTGQAGMRKTSHSGMIIIARFSRKSGQTIPTYGTGQVLTVKNQIINT
jgi:hypothetical protein